MDTSFGWNAFSGQPAASNAKPHGSLPARFLDNDYLIGLGLALRKKRGTEYLTGSGNTVQRQINNQLQRVTLQYTNRSFYFSSIFEGTIVVFNYLPQSESMAHYNEYAMLENALRRSGSHRSASSTRLPRKPKPSPPSSCCSSSSPAASLCYIR